MCKENAERFRRVSDHFSEGHEKPIEMSKSGLQCKWLL